jgi:hypothetical protein
MSVVTPAAALETFLMGGAMAVLLYPLLSWRIKSLQKHS